MPIKISGPIIRNIWHTSSQMTILQREKIQTLTSLVVFIKLRSSVNMPVSNYTNKHLMFHKGEYVRHPEPAVMDDTTIDQRETHQTNSVTLKKMMVETVTPETFNPPCHELSQTIQHKLNALLWEYESQFTKDELQLELHLSSA